MGEEGRFHIAKFDVISFMIGRDDLRRSRNWFGAAVDELLAVIALRNSTALALVGAIIPKLDDSRATVREIVATNAVLQTRCWSGNDRQRLEYTRPGKVLLARGGSIQDFFGPDGRLSPAELRAFESAIVDKFQSAGLVSRAAVLRQENFGVAADGFFHPTAKMARRSTRLPPPRGRGRFFGNQPQNQVWPGFGGQ